MKKIYFSISLLGLFINVSAQQFKEISTPIKDFYYSSSAIEDINGDGNLDILITGGTGSSLGYWDNIVTEVYSNTNNNFELYDSFGKNSIRYGDVKFIDFNNDGLPDIITTGHDDMNNVKQFRFKNTGNSFLLEEETDGIIQGDLEVFDFNHDGLLDYAQNGSVSQYSGTSKNLDLFINTKNGFNQQKKWLPGTFGGNFKFIDLNNDGDLDLAIMGFKEDNTSIFNIYMYENGEYVLKNELTPMSSGKMAYADFNSDGYLDLVAVGQDNNYNEQLVVYYNNNDGTFTKQLIPGGGLTSSYIDVGDLNNDGFYDFIIKGNDTSYNSKTKLYFYDPIQQKFNLKSNSGIENLSGSGGKINIFDFDNDNKLDVLITGEDRDNWEYLPNYTKLYKNTITDVNEKPTAPKILENEVSDNKIIFRWSGATDDKTPEKSLQYEISVGSESGKSDIAKYIVTSKNWYLLKDKLPANFYWSVKSIDAGKVFSDKSEEKIFSSLKLNDIKNKTLNLYPNPAKNNLYIDNYENVLNINAYDINGNKMNIKISSSKSIEIGSLNKGVYIFEIILKNGEKIIEKIIKQ